MKLGPTCDRSNTSICLAYQFVKTILSQVAVWPWGHEGLFHRCTKHIAKGSRAEPISFHVVSGEIQGLIWGEECPIGHSPLKKNAFKNCFHLVDSVVLNNHYIMCQSGLTPQPTRRSVHSEPKLKTFPIQLDSNHLFPFVITLFNLQTVFAGWTLWFPIIIT